MSKKQKRMVQFGFIFYYVSLIFAFLYTYMNQMEGFKMGFVAAFTCCLVPLTMKIFKLKPIFEIYMVNLVFAYIASIGGSMLGAYSLPFFDKLLHFSSGLFICELGYMLHSYLKESPQVKNKKENIELFVFINAFNMMIAVFWEFFEYGCLIFLNNDAIRHYTSGVHDSMTDMLVALCGGLIVSIMIYRFYKTGKKNFWVSLNQHFYDLNFGS